MISTRSTSHPPSTEQRWCSGIALSPTERRWHYRRLSLLGEVLGPDGHGPSSSHTIAPQRIANYAHQQLGGVPDHAEVTLVNSFATTGEGHRTPEAVIAGLLGFSPTDHRTPDAVRLGIECGLAVVFQRVQQPDEHPNTLIFSLRRGAVHLDLTAISIGGGIFEVSKEHLLSVPQAA